MASWRPVENLGQPVEKIPPFCGKAVESLGKTRRENKELQSVPKLTQKLADCSTFGFWRVAIAPSLGQ